MKARPRRVYLPVMVQPPAVVTEIYDAFDEPRCIWCDRTRSRHATPVDLGDGTTMVPACETINGGGRYPGDRPVRVETRPTIRSLDLRLHLASRMSPRDAEGIAGSLGQPSKMPGAAYGLDAFRCRVGSQLAGDPTSTCHGCYARKNFYRTWRPAIVARERREAGIHHPYWVEAMICLIRDYIGRGGEPAFRWHDSGDLHGAWHLGAICAVAEATPDVRHWIPTREYDDVVEYLRAGGRIPENLAVRLSAHYVGKAAQVPAELARLPTSTTHRKGDAPPVARKGAIVCRAIDADVNMCRGCRACWDGRVTNVSYRMH
jgi:hypothetical protein